MYSFQSDLIDAEEELRMHVISGVGASINYIRRQ
jgi:hypothetical protein